MQCCSSTSFGPSSSTHSHVTSPHISSSLWSPCQSNNNLAMQRDTVAVKVRPAIKLSCASSFLLFSISSLSSKENLSDNLYSQSSHLPLLQLLLSNQSDLVMKVLLFIVLQRIKRSVTCWLMLQPEATITQKRKECLSLKEAFVWPFIR